MSRSVELFAQAQAVIPGGVNSPVRAFKTVGGTPVFFKRAEGAFLVDEDEKRYVDYVCSWGPMIVGHAHPRVVAAVQSAAADGLGFGAPTALETEVAQTICKLLPSIDKVRMVNSGTEATMSALRLARGHTGRDKLIKFEGCYHGHVDSLLVKAGSGALTLGVPTSPGISESLAKDTLVLSFNDMAGVEQTFAEHGDEIAAVIVEPVPGNMNCVPPNPGFLQCLREQCDASGALLIFDEVMTGFRVGLHGAQGRFNITPDLTALGKVIGGGLPVGAFGGRADVMASLAPTGPVYQAGTLSGNPVALSAGLATLELIQEPGFFDQLEAQAGKLLDGLETRAREAGIGMLTNQVGTMFGIFFTESAQVSSFADVMDCDQERFNAFFAGMLDAGVYLAPSAFEAGFISSAHDDAVIESTLDAAERVLKSLS